LLSHPTYRRELFGAPAAGLLDRGEVRRLAGNGSAVFSPEVPGRLALLTQERIAELLERRRSVRDYADRPVSREQLAEVCAGGAQASAVLATAPEGLTRSARWLVWARRVDGLPPGIHSYEPTGGFSFVAALPDDRTWAHAVQSKFTDAPCLVLPLWELDNALREDGTDGYFNLLLATGSSLYVAWLTALDLGLAGCLLRDIHPALLSSDLALGGISARPFLTLALGYPHPPEHAATADPGHAGDPS
jgi:nitroreductase